MAGNVLTGNPIYIDTAGVVTTLPLWIKKIVLVPATNSSAATLKYWIEYPGAEDVHKQNIVTDASAAGVLTSTGNFVTTTLTVTDAIHIYKSSTGLNLGVFEISANTDNNHVHTLPLTATDAADAVYSWKVYTSYPLTVMSTTAFPNYEIDFKGKGFYVPNLMVTVLTTGLLYIYL